MFDIFIEISPGFFSPSPVICTHILSYIGCLVRIFECSNKFKILVTIDFIIYIIYTSNFQFIRICVWLCMCVCLRLKLKVKRSLKDKLNVPKKSHFNRIVHHDHHLLHLFGIQINSFYLSFSTLKKKITTKKNNNSEYRTSNI